MNNQNESLNWEKWKKVLGTALDKSRNVGLSDKIIESSVKKIGDFIAMAAEPENESEKLLLNLWKTATKEEKKVIARLLIKMIDGSNES